jgi:hypothetical protein
VLRAIRAEEMVGGNRLEAVGVQRLRPASTAASASIVVWMTLL